MFAKNLILKNRSPNLSLKKFYTCIVERHERVPLLSKGVDVRKYNLKSKHFQYKLVECTHTQKWGNIDVLLTEYVEGIGHKGEVVNVDRHIAYYDLIPARLAVYPTDEYLEMFKEERESLSTKSKVSPFAMKTKEELSQMVLDVPMNVDTEWVLEKDNIRIALRYSKIMSNNDSIHMDENLKITDKNWKDFSQEPFVVKIKINDYISADLKCRIVPINIGKLWEDFSTFNKTI
ncbi:39S ribosomal mitochondrial [Brachionus plicatilis]|uniref:Large ribosomal subunit protein bL9m n=1 Tax=Brachionus plicatilis TaxID=10195 RepID=A0A3M7RPA1_BRAPC|nr:39S ribosomal mitochondrial [Brachionus plicatilis]